MPDKRPPPKPPALPPITEPGPRRGEATQLRRPPMPARTPARHEDEPPLTPHRILIPVDHVPPPPASIPAPPSRKDSPAGGFRIESKWGRISVTQVALVAILAAIGSWYGSKAVSKGESTELADVLQEVRAGRKDVHDLKGDVADIREEQRKARSNDTKILNFAEDTFTPMVASLRKLGVKIDYDGKSDPARDIEFHPAPLGGSAPPIQPKATLPERPSL
jgi:hypothetical protein